MKLDSASCRGKSEGRCKGRMIAGSQMTVETGAKNLPQHNRRAGITADAVMIQIFGNKIEMHPIAKSYSKCWTANVGLGFCIVQ